MLQADRPLGLTKVAPQFYCRIVVPLGGGPDLDTQQSATAPTIGIAGDVDPSRRRADALRERGEQFRQLLDALPAAVYTTDAGGRLTFYNQAAVAFSGRKPELGSDQWCVSWRLYWPDGRPMRHDECPMAVALRTGQS